MLAARGSGKAGGALDRGAAVVEAVERSDTLDRGDIVVQLDPYGMFHALAADTGKELWSFDAQRGIVARPVGFRAGGQRYRAVLTDLGGSMDLTTQSDFMRRPPPNGVLLAFKIGGTRKLDPLPPIRPCPYVTSNERFTPAQMEEWAAQFVAFRAIGHNGPVNLDLMRSFVATSAEAWKAVVHEGVLAGNGMISFALPALDKQGRLSSEARMGEMTLGQPGTGERPEGSGGAEAGNATAPLSAIQRELLGAHFLLLSPLLRRSARLDYAGFQPHNVVERRLMLTLFRIEEARVSELAGVLGNDVAQISRALAGLRAAGLAQRERQRDPYVLTETGAKLGALLDALALQREEELGRGLQAHEMFELAGLLSNLLTRATAILREEIALSQDDERPEARAMVGVPEIHSRLQPAILNLGTIIARSATLAFKRLAGLSQYEWRLLANIASQPGITFMEVVGLIDSDKAQVSRALDGMVSNGLLARGGGKGRQAVRFTVTDEGHRLHAIMRDDAVGRNARIVEDLKPGQRWRLQAYVNRVVENAVAMAERRLGASEAEPRG